MAGSARSARWALAIILGRSAAKLYGMKSNAARIGHAFHMVKGTAILFLQIVTSIFLDAQHRIIELKQMFRGTVTQTSVYPREVVKAALACNSAAVVLAHNHPSGSVEPSRADEYLTQTLKSALALVDVRVLDHLVVAGADVCAFSERGLL